MSIRQNCLVEAVLTSTHNLCLEEKYENYQNYSSESFNFLLVKFSVYLNRRVFVMDTPIYNFLPIIILDQGCGYKFIYLMSNSADPDQLSSLKDN